MAAERAGATPALKLMAAACSHEVCEMAAAWLPLSAAMTGCYTLSLMQDPRPLAPGTARGSVGMSFNPGPSLHLAARVGVLPHVKLRAKLSALSQDSIQSAQLDLNIELSITKNRSIFYMPYARFERQHHAGVQCADDRPRDRATESVMGRRTA